ncbi:hypothetical protein BER93_07685 [Xanthomonas fragariae]|nr:hypothetical protein BER92_07660 [Xanthomonas fragariae]AOD18028.1 hypothetical protein BER93_07685 [Xanthomonas fragariae]ENZ94823.1 hypothetical protein O1K_12826 [Xanthomonas fragariae LMG 25863]
MQCAVGDLTAAYAVLGTPDQFQNAGNQLIQRTRSDQASGDRDPQRRQVAARCTSQVVTRCATLVRRFQPSKNRPRKVASRKNAIRLRRRRQWCTDDIAGVVAVVRAVHAELEVHDDAGADTHGKVDAEQHAPEHGQPLGNL